ncbi:hypothetical protein J14TS2_42380 [Bacillus sp. J14TS2]|uniref:polysaccharide deacetylase family protein n=1 Tax=Bacillus sp. J14TS2 TaxID=2807188 RepID=UPI001B0D814F|nr:polysaccharide deacetylase family protein [Bacillus sp. J14TS2]GIN73763.1 hypothetical protein J14TS2_42380 [Bacillus sp. J14TS2]
MKHLWMLACLFLCFSPLSLKGKMSANLTFMLDNAQVVSNIDPPSDLSKLKNKYKSTFLMKGPESKREVALTFDDAPDETFTPIILDILKQKDVKATFFLVGYRIEKYPDVVKRIVQEGHAIGNHSYNHPDFLTLSNTDFWNQIGRTDELIESYTGFKPTIVRPPYGNINDKQLEWLASHKRIVVNWNVDSLDWKGLDAEQVTNNILLNVTPGSIILQHSGTGDGGDLSGTIRALPIIIDKLKEDDYKLVTVQELLEVSSKQ